MNHQQNIRNGELGPFTCSLSLHFIKNQNHEKRGLEKEHISLSIDIYIYISVYRKCMTHESLWKLMVGIHWTFIGHILDPTNSLPPLLTAR
jgi:hypothetical protein